MSKKNFKIQIVPNEEKFSLVKQVKPNIIYNRFDILEYNDFHLVAIKYESHTEYISFVVNESICNLGIYMMNIEKVVLDEVMNYLSDKFNIEKFSFGQSLNIYPKTKETMHWKLALPSSYDDYMQQFSSKTRYNRKKELQKLEKSFHCKYEHLNKDEISLELINRFVLMKSQKVGVKHLVKTLSLYLQVTDAFLLYLNGELAAICLYSIMQNSSDACCLNMAYDLNFEKYFVGNILFYYSIKKLIEQKISNIYMGGGDYSYKQNAHCIKNITCMGTTPPPKRLLPLYYSNTERRVKLNFFGIKISIKKRGIK